MNLTQISRSEIIGQQTKARMLRAGRTLKGDKLWTDEEDKVLRVSYPDYRQMQVKLPHRTKVAVYRRCAKLGMKRDRHEWKASELSRLRRLYHRKATRQEIMTEFPELTWASISTRARYHGISGPYRHKYVKTGKPVIDAILARLEEIDWKLLDLDEASKSGKYFRNQCWRRWKPNMKFVQRAVQAMDGELKASWKEYN
ncbi:hypothetical protein [Rhizobium sp. Leaf262]|uniref:hypothetical protein n=1 Tax=Rhizobium sp. Leaf262 TaxID=1736312 RepID=UPI000713CA43|nr:hypothetical protein [Rhizobium sp. Leaf262]KQO80847.1 hypothetical protein ASF29_18695 [Rhizobium sp. Leaf262]